MGPVEEAGWSMIVLHQPEDAVVIRVAKALDSLASIEPKLVYHVGLNS
jgi:hypothetical protein